MVACPPQAKGEPITASNMTAPQIEIKQGKAFQFTLDVSPYPLPPGVTWEAALVNPSTDMRYVANASVSGNIVTFAWPSGLVDDASDPDYGKMDTDNKNGTAWMSVATHDLEVYRSDHADMGVLYGRFRVTKSNFMAKNAPAGKEEEEA